MFNYTRYKGSIWDALVKDQAEFVSWYIKWYALLNVFISIQIELFANLARY